MSESQPRYPVKKLLLNLVKEADQPLSAQVLVKIAGLFAIRAGNVRVALNRLCSDGYLIQPERGVYALGPEAMSLADLQRRWSLLESDLVDWDGSWYVLSVAHLGRSDRRQLRRRERAVRLSGFREVLSGLLVRPANLIQPLAELKHQLCRLGVEKEAVLMSGVRFGVGDEPSPALWQPQELSLQYRQLTEQMTQWLASSEEARLNHGLAGLSEPGPPLLDDLARESFLIGDRVLWAIAYDPRLPQEMVDTAARSEMIETMKHFDKIGNVIWAELIAQLSPAGAG